MSDADFNAGVRAAAEVAAQYDTGDGAQGAILALLRPETPAPEPVAWQAKGDDGIWRYVEMPRTAKAMGMPMRPLYAEPQP